MSSNDNNITKNKYVVLVESKFVESYKIKANSEEDALGNVYEILDELYGEDTNTTHKVMDVFTPIDLTPIQEEEDETTLEDELGKSFIKYMTNIDLR